jgi:hypothetical protein
MCMWMHVRFVKGGFFLFSAWLVLIVTSLRTPVACVSRGGTSLQTLSMPVICTRYKKSRMDLKHPSERYLPSLRRPKHVPAVFWLNSRLESWLRTESLFGRGMIMYLLQLYMYQLMASVRTWNQTEDLCKLLFGDADYVVRDLMGGLNLTDVICFGLWIIS